MINPSIDTTDDRLTAYALGELDEAGRAEFEQLLASRPDLQQELKELEALAGLLRQELLAEPKLSLTAEQHQQVLGCAGGTQAPVSMVAPAVIRRRRIRRWAVIGAEVALGVAFTAGIVHFSTLNRQPQTMVDRFQELKPGTSAEPRGDHNLVRLTDSSAGKLADSDGYEALYSKTDAPMANYQVDSLGLISDPKPASGLPSELSGSSGSRTTWSDGTTTGPVTGASTVGLYFDAQLAKESGEREGRVKDAGPARRYMVRSLATVESAPNSSDLALTAPAVDFVTNGEAVELKYRYSGEGESRTNESYVAIAENPFVGPSQQPLSTFSIDVDTASYANVRRFLTQGQMPPADAVRIEEMVNYFSYDYPQPKVGDPFSVTADAAPCPWQRDHYLARIALQARTIDKAKRPPTNLVFLLDVSGSMQAANKLPLVKQAMTMLTEELNERDRIAIVTYAGDAGVKLASTPGSDQSRVMQSIEALQAGGSTNGAAGINLAYEEALRHFNGEGENRVILCTDGDFNVGISDDEQLVQLIQRHAKSKVFLSIFGFGMGNLKDAKLEQLADKGNGHYGYIDDLREARRVFNEELVGTLYTVAKDVKIQVEFNPLTVGAYRLIGYENRALAAKDFNDDTKDAGEIGAGHTVTALYEIVPKGKWLKAQAADALKYTQATAEPAAVEPPKANLPPESADDLFTVKLRFKQPTADTSVKSIDYVVDDIAGKNIVPPADFRWSAAVAAFGMQLRNSQFKGQWTLDDIYEAGQGAKGTDSNGRRREFLDLVQAAKRLSPTTVRDGKAGK